mgnify:CR=1 FL=1
MAFEHLGKTGTQWLISKVKSSLDTKVDKVEGKGLSSNDFTTALKTKYDAAAADVDSLKAQSTGEMNRINSITVNGTAVEPDEYKNVALTVPTTASIKTQIEAYKYQTSAQVQSAITAKGYQTAENVETAITEKGYQTATQVNTAITGKGYQTSAQVESAITAKGYQTSAEVQSAIKSALSGVTSIDLQVVKTLPETGKKGVIYLVAHSHSDTDDIYDEFMWVESTKKFEKIGNTDVNLSAYVKSADITDISETELAAMWNA